MGLNMNESREAESLLNQIMIGLSPIKLSGNLNHKVEQCAEVLDKAFEDPKKVKKDGIALERKVQMLVNFKAKFDKGINKTAEKAVDVCNQHMAEALKKKEKQPDPSLMKLSPALKTKLEAAVKEAKAMNERVTKVLSFIATTTDLVFGRIEKPERFVNLDFKFIINENNDAFKKVNYCAKEIANGFRSIGISGDMKDWNILNDALTKLESEKFDKQTKAALAECRKAAAEAKAAIEKDISK